MVGVDVDGRDHVVGSRSRSVIVVRAKFEAHILVIETVEESCEALVCGEVLVLHEIVSLSDVCVVFFGRNVTVLAFAHGVILVL